MVATVNLAKVGHCNGYKAFSSCDENFYNLIS